MWVRRRRLSDRNVLGPYCPAAALNLPASSAGTHPRGLDAVKTVAEVPGQHPTSFGGECDLLAVDARGRLLAVEIKPRNVSSIAWVGIQATIYAELFTRWLRSPRSAAADQPAVIIRDMLDQRTRLGLASPNRAALPDEPEVVPVVAIQRDSREVSSIASDLYTGPSSTHLAAPEPTWRSTKSA